MNRGLRMLLIVGVAFAFTILADRAAPRYPAFSHNVTAPGVLIMLVIYMALRLDFLGNSPLPGYLSIAVDTLIYSGLIALLLKLCKRRHRRHNEQP